LRSSPAVCASTALRTTQPGAITAPAPPAPLVLTTNLAVGTTQAGVDLIATNIGMVGATQFAAQGTIGTTSNNGSSAGSLSSFSVGPAGDITGIFSNGVNRSLGQIALAVFTNAAGLTRIGSNAFEPTSNSGVAIVGVPGNGGRGMLGTGVLEGSNTDLAREFTNVILAQRGFQASSRVISTSDEIFRDLVSLIR
jgi:flagellar hook protein FlgE